MEPNFIEVFDKILKIGKPWLISKTEVIHNVKVVNFYIDYEPGSKFKCSECGKLCGVYDGSYRLWRHLDICDYRCYLNIKIPRTKCMEHGVRVIKEHDYGRINCHFSFKFEKLIMEKAKTMSISAIAQELGEVDTTLWNTFNYHVSNSIKQIDCSKTRKVSVDETASKRGHHYMSVFTDIDTGRVIYVTPGKDSDVFARFYQALFEHTGDPNYISKISMDMSKSFISGQQEYFTSAQIVFDRFHIKKALNEAVDTVRKQERDSVEELKKTKYIWLKNPCNLTEEQQLKLGWFLERASTKTAKAYGLKVSFDQLWGIQSNAVEPMLNKWLEQVSSSAMQPMFKFGRMIKKHYKGVINSMTSVINNGFAEGLNSLIQLTKSRARGFRNMDNFKNMIYFIGNEFKFSFH